MNIYYVTCAGDWFSKYLVKANSKREAINLVFDNYFKPINAIRARENKEAKQRLNMLFTKKDLMFEAVEINALINTNNNAVLCLDGGGEM